MHEYVVRGREKARIEASEQSYQRYSVDSAERVVGYDYRPLHILESLNAPSLDTCIEFLQNCFREVNSDAPADITQCPVNIPGMNESFERPQDGIGKYAV